MVGQGLSLSDASRYMEQLKTQFGDQQEIKDMIDQAYKLAVTRYETTYARSEEEYKQKQEQYTQQKERYETHYQDTRKEQEQKQAAYEKGEGQTDRDRNAQIENFYHTRERADTSYNQRVAEAAQDRERRINVFGEDRQMAMADYNRRVQEAQQDRQKGYSTFDQQMTRHMGREDRREAEVAQDRAKQYGMWDEQYGAYKDDYGRRVAEAQEERGLDKAGYAARHAIGATCGIRRSWRQVRRGSNPLSAAARERINTQSEEEMARRGVAGGGMYSNLLAAKAFAPAEAQLWENAMQTYMTGQRTALDAYTQQDMTMSPSTVSSSCRSSPRQGPTTGRRPPTFQVARSIATPACRRCPAPRSTVAQRCPTLKTPGRVMFPAQWDGRRLRAYQPGRSQGPRPPSQDGTRCLHPTRPTTVARTAP